MSGHSKWATIKRQKGKADAARGKVFSRLIREITVAARMGGADPGGNPRLRSAISTARNNNMPNKNIETAIAKGTGQLEGATYEEITFEAYAPNGVAILVETVTDNRNRTVAEIRHLLTKAGGSLGGTNSVNWMFKTKGVIRVPREAKAEEELMELAIEAGAEDMATEDEYYEITTSSESFDDVRSAIEQAGIAMESAELNKIPDNTVSLSGDAAMKVLKLIDALDDCDDTQHVYSNLDVDDDVLEKYSSS